MCSDPTETRSQFIIVAQLLSLIAFAWERNVLRTERMLCFWAPGNLWCPKYQRVRSAFYKPAIFYNQFVFDGMLLKSRSRYGVVCVVFSWKASLSRGGAGNHLRWEAIIEHFQIRPVCFSQGCSTFVLMTKQIFSVATTVRQHFMKTNKRKMRSNLFTLLFFVCLFVSRGNFVVYFLAAAA